MFDLHAVSIFATGTGESDTTTPILVLQVVFTSQHHLSATDDVYIFLFL
jgi:hypothetical protein